MKIPVAELSVGDRLDNYRRGSRLRITAIRPWSGGGGEVSFTETLGTVTKRREMTFRQFEKMVFLRRAGTP